MKLLRLILILCCVSSNLLARQIKFEEKKSWNSIAEKAKRSNKYIFLDAYTSWCGPCKHMDQNVFTDPSVAKFFNETFICVRMQMDASPILKKQVPLLQSADSTLGKFRINAYPAMLFLSPSGELVRKVIGARNARELIWEGQKALDSTTAPLKGPIEPTIDSLKSIYNNGKADAGSIRKLARKTKDSGDVVFANRIAKQFIDGLTNDSLFVSENIWFVYEFTNSVNDRGYAFFRDRAVEIEKTEPKMEKKYSRGKVIEILYGEFVKPWQTTLNGKPDWEIINENLHPFGKLGEEVFRVKRPIILFHQEIKPLILEGIGWQDISAKLNALKVEADPFVVKSILYTHINLSNNGKSISSEQLIGAAKLYTLHFLNDRDPQTLNEIGWVIFKNCNVLSDIQLGINLSARAVKLEPNNSIYLDTYANLIFKSGDKKKGIELEEKALILSNGNGEIKEALEKMKSDVSTSNH